MIELINIQRSFTLGNDTVHALRPLTLSLRQGEHVALMGSSGSGKSTLLNILGLLDRPDSGRYLLDGTDTEHLSASERSILRRHKIGFVFQSFHLIPRLTAEQNVELPLMLAGKDPEERKARVSVLMESMGLADRAQHRPNQLSGGQRQRVAIARAIVMQPQIILADEPTGNLDQKSGLAVLNILDELNDSGITVIVVTHDKGVARRADRIFSMSDGVLTSDSEPAG